MRVLLIAHLFYGDLLESSFSYLQNLPAEVDLVITTPPQNIVAVERLLEKYHRRAKAVLPAGMRGRDAGALLVAAHPYLLQYDVLGFVHDKKTTGGVGSASIGEKFRELIWGNLLGDREVILRALKRFEAEPDLGMLVPPAPMEDEYFLLFGAPWANGRAISQSVLDRISVKKSLQKADRPLAVGTAFWCRTRAMRKLFSYPFRYEDFPQEPLPLDGSFNHGIERSLSFIAQEAGFRTECLMSRWGMEQRCKLQEEALQQLCGVLAQEYYYVTAQGLLEELKHHNLQKFCETFSELYIYGAGYHGRRLLPILARMDMQAKAFLVTDGYDMPTGLPIYCQYLSELTVHPSMGIIVAASPNGYQPSMRQELEKLGWPQRQCYFLR